MQEQGRRRVISGESSDRNERSNQSAEKDLLSS